MQESTCCATESGAAIRMRGDGDCRFLKLTLVSAELFLEDIKYEGGKFLDVLP